MEPVEFVRVGVDADVQALLVEDVRALGEVEHGDLDAGAWVEQECEVHLTAGEVVLASEEPLEGGGAHQDRLVNLEDQSGSVWMVGACYCDHLVLVIGWVDPVIFGQINYTTVIASLLKI